MFKAATKAALYGEALATSHRINPDKGAQLTFFSSLPLMPPFNEISEECKVGVILAASSIYYFSEVLHSNGYSKTNALQISSSLMAAGFFCLHKLCEYLVPESREEYARPRF